MERTEGGGAQESLRGEVVFDPGHRGRDGSLCEGGRKTQQVVSMEMGEASLFRMALKD